MSGEERILFVDDEPRLLAGIRRQLRRRYSIETVASPLVGLDALKQSGPFAVVVSDMQLPGPMNGAAFLGEVRKRAPAAVRMILTGHADVQSAIDAVNDGGIFRFLTKPCDTETLTQSIETALNQHRAQEAQARLQETTIDSAVVLAAGVAAFWAPDGTLEVHSVRRCAHDVACSLEIPDAWGVGAAAALACVARAALPAEVLEKVDSGQELAESERDLLQSRVQFPCAEFEKHRRLENIAAILRRYGVGPPVQSATRIGKRWDPVEVGSAIVGAAVACDRSLRLGGTEDEALEKLTHGGSFSQEVLDAIQAVQHAAHVRYVAAEELEPGMILDEDVRDSEGRLLVGQGVEVTLSMQARLLNYSTGRREPIRVLGPRRESPERGSRHRDPSAALIEEGA